MAIINLYNKKLNVTYVYDSVSYWDKDLKQPRSKRKLIGKRDPVTNEIIPTSGRGRRQNTDASSENKPVHSDSSVELKYEKCLEAIREKDATIQEQKKQIADLQSRLRACLSAMKQAESLLNKTSSGNDING